VYSCAATLLKNTVHTAATDQWWKKKGRFVLEAFLLTAFASSMKQGAQRKTTVGSQGF